MSLYNIYGYLYGDEAFKGKTIKLSDSYQVRIRLNDSDFAAEQGLSDSKSKFALRIPQPDHNEVELFECTSVTLPSYKPKEDIFEYGNNSKSFIYMDPTSLDDLEIELIEHYNNDNTLIVQNLVNLFLSKLFDEEAFVYKLDDYIPELTVLVFSNIFCPVILRYVFKELKLTDYTKYDLDYSSTDIAKWTLKFSYRSFYVVEESPEFREDEAEDVTEEDISTGDTEETEETTSAPNIDVPDPTQTEDKKEQDQTPPKQDDNPMEPPVEQNTETPSNTDDAVTAPPENAENAGQQPSENNTELKNQFNATGEQPDKQPTDNEVVLDEVAIKADKQETNTAANSNPVDLEKLSEEDRIDELAYRMMRGELDNGKPRYGKTYDAGYSEEERSKAQSVVNEMDWEGLKERHDARVANMLNTDNEYAASEDNKPMNNNVAVTEEATIDSTPELTALSEPIEQDPIKKPMSETPKPEESTTSAGPKISEEKLAKAGISKADPNERKYQGLTSTQWGEIAAKQDMQDGLREDNRGLNYDMLYCNGEIEKDKFKTAYEDYMSRNNKDSKTEQVAQTEQPEPEEVVEEQPKQEVKKQTIVKQNPDLITLTEADIDKYVPFLYKAAARGYFNKYKDEQGTLTLVVNEKMIDDNVPAIFRSTAKKAYKEYMADHPKQN